MPQTTASLSSRQCAAIGAGVAAGEVEDVVAHRLGRDVHRLARDDRAGAGEGAGVVGRAIGVGIDDGDVAGAHAHDRGGHLLVRRGDAVAHLGRADGQVIGAVGESFISAPERCSVGGPHSSMASATPVPSAQCSPSGLATPLPLRQLALDDVEALGDAVAAETGVAGLLPDRFDVVAGPHDVLAPHLDRVDVEQARQLVDGAFDREGRLRGAVAAEAAARDHVGVDGVARRPSCCRSDRRRSGSPCAAASVSLPWLP